MAVFPGWTVEQWLSDIGEAVLYQAETIKANGMGYDRVTLTKTGVDDDFRKRWEATTGRIWSHES